MGSFRRSFSFNRSLIKDKLAVYGAFLYNDQQFERKPSCDLTRRQYGAITYKPFQKTVIRGFAENFENHGQPAEFHHAARSRDAVVSGRPSGLRSHRAHDHRCSTRAASSAPTCRSLSPGYNAAVNAVIGTGALTTTTSPLYLPGIQFDDPTRPLRRIDNGGRVDFFQRSSGVYAPAHTNPGHRATDHSRRSGWTANDPRFTVLDRHWTHPRRPASIRPHEIDGRTYTYGSYQAPGVTNKSIYDWTKYNHTAAQFRRVRANYNLELEQQILRQTSSSAPAGSARTSSRPKTTRSPSSPAQHGPDRHQHQADRMAAESLFRAALSCPRDRRRRRYILPARDRRQLSRDARLRSRLHEAERQLDEMARPPPPARALVEAGRAIARPNAGASASRTATPRQAALHAQSHAPGTPSGPAHHQERHYWRNPGDPQGVGRIPPAITAIRAGSGPSASRSKATISTPTSSTIVRSPRNSFLEARAASGQREVKSWNLGAQSYLWSDRLVATVGWRHDDYRARVTTGRRRLD